MEEIWKDIPQYIGMYQISSLGRIKSLERRTRGKLGSTMTRKERILCFGSTPKGYLMCALGTPPKRISYTVHRLVAKAFIPNPENKPQINHKNCIKTDNRIENLEWCTNNENQDHAKKHNLLKWHKGQECHQSTLMDSDLEIIQQLKRDGMSLPKIALKLNVSYSAVYNMYKGKTFKYLKR